MGGTSNGQIEGRVGTSSRYRLGKRSLGSGAYTGPDRRSGTRVSAPNPREFALAAVILMVVCVPFALLGGREPYSRPLDTRTLSAALGGMTSLLAGVVATAGALRWKLTGDATSLRIGMAVSFVGVASGAQVVAAVAPTLDPNGALLVVGSAASVAAGLGLAVAFAARDVDSRLDVRHALFVPLLTFAAASLAIAGVPWLADPLAPPRAVASIVGGLTPVRFGSMVVFAGLAVVYTWRGLERARWLHTWIGLMLFALAMSSGLRVLATVPGDVRLTGASILALCGLGFALNGAARELAAAYTEQRALLFDTEVEAEAVESLHRAEREAHEERAHDAQSALLAVQAAIRVLERGSLTLFGAARHELVGALDAELTRLRDLLSMDPLHMPPRMYRVVDAVRPVVLLRTAAGAQVRAEIPPDVEAFGRPEIVAEIVDNLVANALKYAPGSPIDIRACPDTTVVHVRVEDSGPGIPERDRERIFQRGERGDRHHATGAGFGLFVARRLARDHGGDLFVEPRDQGSAFVVVLPMQAPVVGDGGAGPGADAVAPGRTRAVSSKLRMRCDTRHVTLSDDGAPVGSRRRAGWGWTGGGWGLRRRGDPG
jgi:signal transduction histidine kinase